MNTHSNQPVRVRFAPSPTGFVHIGSLRTALFNFLFVRHHGGTNILRIEDTDQTRLVPGAVENLLRVMSTLGIEFDEGPHIENSETIERGEYGPYVQSTRKSNGLYEKHAEILLQSGKAYYCFCDEQRLDELRKEQTALKKPPMYDKLCRKLSSSEVTEKLSSFQQQGKRPVVRQAIPDSGQTKIQDLIYGEIVIENHILDDQVLLKSDGFPTYHLAVVVDDHFMNISHVIRGEEWIASTPKHILLYEAFGWKAPEFAHLPLILNRDKSKLSKRQGDVAVEDFLKKGYLKETLLNFVALLGWNPKSEQEIFSLTDLVKEFDLEKINKSGAVFDQDKLDWMNGIYTRNLRAEDLTDLLVPYWFNDGYLTETQNGYSIYDKSVISKDYLILITRLEQERLKRLGEIGERTAYFFREPEYETSLLVWKKSTLAQTLEIVQKLIDFVKTFSQGDFERNAVELKLKEFITQNNFDNGSVLWPLRTALTGLAASPGPFDVLAVLSQGLGHETIVKRLEKAAVKLAS